MPANYLVEDTQFANAPRQCIKFTADTAHTHMQGRAHTHDSMWWLYELNKDMSAVIVT